MKKLKYIFVGLLMLAYSLIFAQDPDPCLADPELCDDILTGGGVTVTPPHGLGSQATPIEMYEGVLIALALLMIIGYYMYVRRNRRMVKL